VIHDPGGGLRRREVGHIEVECGMRADIDQTRRLDLRSHTDRVDRLEPLSPIRVVDA